MGRGARGPEISPLPMSSGHFQLSCCSCQVAISFSGQTAGSTPIGSQGRTWCFRFGAFILLFCVFITISRVLVIKGPQWSFPTLINLLICGLSDLLWLVAPSSSFTLPSTLSTLPLPCLYTLAPQTSLKVRKSLCPAKGIF